MTGERIKIPPSVSVVMPVYNGQRYVEAAIRSVMAQTFPEWELLVIDDGSQDNTCPIVEKLAQEDTRIRLIRNTANQGVARTRNRGLDLSGGDYVALLDGDDLWRPEKLERQWALAENTGADIIYCGYGMIGPDGAAICRDFPVPESTDFHQMLVKSVISCSTVMFSRRAAKTYRFSEDYSHEDLVLWLRMLGDGCRAAGIPEVLADYRVTPGSRSGNKLRAAWGRWEIYRKLLGFPFGKSLVLLVRYGLLGLKKYRRAKI